MLPYAQVLAFVQQIAPTWCKPQHVNFAQLVGALIERENLALSDLARALPQSTQALHGRLKRLGRFLDNPHLDEVALFIRWLKLSYRFGADLPVVAPARPVVPLLLDTVYFNPFALLVCTVPCGSRGLPIALTTYHPQALAACFPSRATWPSPDADPNPPRPRRLRWAPGRPRRPARRIAHAPPAQPIAFLSQNQIEEELVDLVFTLLSSALHGVIVADRGFARASFFRFHTDRQRSFVIRFDAQTHIRLPRPLAAGQPRAGTPSEVLGIRPGQRLWCPEAFYGKEEQVPIGLLAVWDADQKEPWFLATNLSDPQPIETLYRWRMRLECANRDEKTGVILREGGDQHALRSVMHLHRLLLALAAAEWLCALTGLQATHDLPLVAVLPLPVPQPVRSPADLTDPTALDHGPADPPPLAPHRGDHPKPPPWLKRFVAWGPLSYVRLGREVLRAPDLQPIVARLTRWLTTYLWSWAPLWHPPQVRYRLRAWWAGTA
jgi:DDE family transposase